MCYEIYTEKNNCNFLATLLCPEVPQEQGKFNKGEKNEKKSKKIKKNEKKSGQKIRAIFRVQQWAIYKYYQYI
jgi:Ni/Co efflux regulator RcnB